MTQVLKGRMILAIGIVAAATLVGPMQARAADAPPGLPTQQLNEFAQVFDLIRSSYVSPVDGGKLIEQAIAGMVSSLDPHSEYLSGDALKEFAAEQAGSFVGIGVEAELAEGGFKVIATLDGSPAASAGLRAGDLLVQVDGKRIASMTRFEAGRSLRGAEGSEVALGVMPADGGARREIRLRRRAIHEPSVKLRFIEPGYAVLRIAEFRQSTLAEFGAAVKALANAPVKGIVLDLRDNPGGLLASGVGVAAGFLPAGATVVSIHGHAPSQPTILRASTRDYLAKGAADPLRDAPPALKTLPLAVLVNAGSASAAEIVAAALQDNHRATLVGETSFGKGSVQDLIPLSETSALKLTVARYDTPSGRSIQALGIRPDLVVRAKDAKQEGSPLREADLEHHLPPEQAGATPERPGGKADAQFAAQPDPQLAAALAYLKRPAQHAAAGKPL